MEPEPVAEPTPVLNGELRAKRNETFMFYRESALARLRGFVVSHEGSSFVPPHRDPDRTVVVL